MSKVFVYLFLLFPCLVKAQPKVIHVFVALCDNQNQGIVPVPAQVGNGQQPSTNLYWGAAYGVKCFFSKSKDWQLHKTIPHPKPKILERCIFRHKASGAYLVADAWDGAFIRETVEGFLSSAAGHEMDTLKIDTLKIVIGGGSDLVTYIGHDALMDTELKKYPWTATPLQKPVIILACNSSGFFATALYSAGAFPLLWTTNLMCPEAYTLHAALDEWLKGRDAKFVWKSAAKAYSTYQKYPIESSEALFKTGW